MRDFDERADKHVNNIENLLNKREKTFTDLEKLFIDLGEDEKRYNKFMRRMFKIIVCEVAISIVCTIVVVILNSI